MSCLYKNQTRNDKIKKKRFVMTSRRSVLVYLAGPYSPYMDYDNFLHTTATNLIVARRGAAELWDLGFTVHCPHLNTANFEDECKCTYEDYLAGDFEIIKRCDAVFFLPDWQRSCGSIQERRLALSKGIPCYYKIEDLLRVYP
jgi:hypothetical protein